MMSDDPIHHGDPEALGRVGALGGGLGGVAPSEPRFTKACGAFIPWPALDTGSKVERLATALRILLTEGGSKTPFPAGYLG